jgi:hypothetical protein
MHQDSKYIAGFDSYTEGKSEGRIIIMKHHGDVVEVVKLSRYRWINRLKFMRLIIKYSNFYTKSFITLKENNHHEQIHHSETPEATGNKKESETRSEKSQGS